ncbi:hypothetical protein ABID52_001892 [Fictibacillus halophilus]|jgi:hypothetical protein|uniref:Phr family secreted Rap phosphatase inhibitor n=1 Tax=Fictibacillus halophilus TaxID=1610490 RepID=A0ABV2LJ01_9BACL|nr:MULTISPECIES: hypothetical protein [Bacillaceae]MED1864388.1 hypothetical protein [Fictibacillus nanhaiensis]
MKKFAAGIIITSLALTAVFVGLSTKSVEQAEHGRTFSLSQKL